mmetsp:Transcript_13610/g.24304  ORF Transcript_13610/g.24304 Transcript_13610/m.24304 type:complete len:1349 (-) Transcript_13610:1088-5134(-)
MEGLENPYLWSEDHLDQPGPSKADEMANTKKSRYVYPVASEESIQQGRICEVDGTDLTQFQGPDGFWWKHMRDPMALVNECVHKGRGAPPIPVIIVCVTGVTDLNTLNLWLIRERRWDNDTHDFATQKSCYRKTSVSLGRYLVQCIGDVSLRDILYVHRSKFGDYPYKGDGLATYADALLRLGTVVGCQVDWSSLYPTDLLQIMKDQQRGVGMNPPRNCIELFQEPDYDRSDEVCRVDAVRSYTSCLRWLFDERHPSRVPAIYGASDCLVPYDETVHGHLPCGHYLVELPPASPLRRILTHYSNNDKGVLVDHNTVRGWLEEGWLPDKGYITKVILPLHSREKKWGARLAVAVRKLLAYAEDAEKSGKVGKQFTKSLINHLVGSWAKIDLCTTTVKTVLSNDPTFLDAMIFLSSRVHRCNKVSIARQSRVDYTFNPSGTEYEYFATRIYSTYPKTFPCHNLYLAVTLRSEMELLMMLRRVPGPRDHSTGLSTNLIACHVDCVEFYGSAPVGDFMTVHAKHAPGAPVEYGKWSVEHRGLRIKPGTSDEPHRGYYESLRMSQGRVRDRSQRSVCAAECANLELNRTEVPFIPDDLPLTKMLRNEMFEKTGHDIASRCHRRLKTPDKQDLPISVTGTAIHGPPGAGKSYAIVEIHRITESAGLDIGVVVPTGAAGEALKQASQNRITPVTVQSFLGIQIANERGRMMRNNKARMMRTRMRTKWKKLDVLIIDEASMVTDAQWEMFLLYKRQFPGCTFIVSGDYNQLPPVLPGEMVGQEFGVPMFGEPNVYTHSNVVQQLLRCPYTNTPGDEWVFRHTMRSALCPVLKEVALNPLSVTEVDVTQWAPDRGGKDREPETEFNICWSNKYKDRLAEKIAIRWIQKRNVEEHLVLCHRAPVGYTANRVPQHATWAVGMPCICVHNDYTAEFEDHIRNNRYGTVTDIQYGGPIVQTSEQQKARVNDMRVVRGGGVQYRLGRPEDCRVTIEWVSSDEKTVVPLDRFAAWFIRSFCITAHSSQGLNLGKDRYVGIHEFDKLSQYCPMGLYVGFTRVESSDQLWIHQSAGTVIKNAYNPFAACCRLRTEDASKDWPEAGLWCVDDWDWDLWIDEAWFEKSWEEQGGNCYTCARPMLRDTNRSDKSLCVTIDRQDNTLPHLRSNCRLACWRCNCHERPKADTVWPPRLREMYTANRPVQPEIDLLDLKMRLTELTLWNTIAAIQRDMATQANRVNSLFHQQKALTPLEYASLLRYPGYPGEVPHEQRTYLERSQEGRMLGVKPCQPNDDKVPDAKSIMLAALRSANDIDEEEDDLDLTVPTIPSKTEVAYTERMRRLTDKMTIEIAELKKTYREMRVFTS